MDQNTTVIEVNGVKLEVDLRTAKRVEELRVGDRVKVLITPSYGEPKVSPGVIVGFEPFKSLPTIIVAYLERDYSGAALKFAYINSKSKDTELVKSIDPDDLEVNRADVLRQIDGEIEKKRAEISDMERKREFFLANFRAYFGERVEG